jgi:LacI family transcriptional regulator
VAVVGAPVLKAHSRFNEALLRYAAQQKHWRFVFSMESSVSALRFLQQVGCDGALVRVTSPEMARVARRVTFPIVNFSSWLAKPGLPTVCDDNAAKGRLCAQHLLNKGFRRFGMVLMPGGWFLEARRESFLETIAAAGYGHSVKVFSLRSFRLDQPDLRRFRRWVASLSPPVGLFLADDLDAPALMNACREAGRQIPGDIAVVAGLGHEEILPLCEPPLSHVRGNDEDVAMRAAEYLDRLMHGRTQDVQTIVLPVQGFVALASSDTVAVDDRYVARAVEFIRAHAGEATNIKSLVHQLSIPRRTLERHFHAAMGTSLHAYLTGERVARARDLLGVRPPISLKEIARRCGFADARRLNEVFRCATGVSLAEARQRADSK